VAAGLVAASAHMFIDFDFHFPAFAGAVMILVGAAGALATPHRLAVRGTAIVVGLAAVVALGLVVGEVAADSSQQAPRSAWRAQVAGWLQPFDSRPAQRLAAEAEARGDRDAAVAASEDWVGLDGLNPRAWFNLGRVRGRFGDLAGQEAAWRQAVRVDPVNPSLCQAWADALFRLGDVEGAFAAIDRGLGIDLRTEDRKWPQLADLAHFGAEMATAHGDTAKYVRYSDMERRLLGRVGISS
jgi:tetratricopeptide (TPR) repeat protein